MTRMSRHPRVLPTGDAHTADASRWEWADSAACAGLPLSLFYGYDGERPDERREREAKALEVCAACPMRTAAACREAALAYKPGQQYGIQGGLTAEQRIAIRRNRMRAEQPARQEVA